MMKRGTFESTIALAYPFLAATINKLRDFNSLEKMDLVVELSSPLDKACRDIRKEFDVALPIYELETFVD